MVNLTRIYTRTGDAGQTRLGDNSVLQERPAPARVRRCRRGQRPPRPGRLGRLARARRRRHRSSTSRTTSSTSAPTCAPRSSPDPEYPPLRVEQSYVDRLEGWCDQYNEPLETLRSFILSGGTPGSAHLHVCRTVVRRAERSAWAAYAEYAESMNPLAMTYLNRLSDLLFILARYSNREQGDVLWVPGGERSDSDPEQQKADHEHRGQARAARRRARRRSGRGGGRRRADGCSSSCSTSGITSVSRAARVRCSRRSTLAATLPDGGDRDPGASSGVMSSSSRPAQSRRTPTQSRSDEDEGTDDLEGKHVPVPTVPNRPRSRDHLRRLAGPSGPAASARCCTRCAGLTGREPRTR